MATHVSLPPFTVTEAAVQFINALREEEEALGSIVTLQEESPIFLAGPNTELGRAISNAAEDSGVLAALTRHVEENPGLMRRRLLPEFVDRVELDPRDIVSLSGIELCMQPEMLDALRGWILDVTDAGLVLRKVAAEHLGF